nr:unnamed protein product [Digitaria exilis]
MAGEELGRRGVPSLLNLSSSSSEEQQEHIASNVTQARTLISSAAASVSFIFWLAFRGQYCAMRDLLFFVYVQQFLQLIGWTPLVELKRITDKDGVDARIIGKVEAYQPLCSIKDRCALRLIEDAEERGLISPGVTTLVEPTSGNMGSRPWLSWHLRQG